ncbi:type III PLP-dependent enzyme [Dasania marina]|uniref:type III PLP-dependent enzyme n=1 Tax=Dasania marina TaxID=471499 RepID=UPI0030DD7B71|tara:strand:- start:84553 stop:85722 length:1170 start_codon:yes stop_codon:yes gene_type:complete
MLGAQAAATNNPAPIAVEQATTAKADTNTLHQCVTDNYQRPTLLLEERLLRAKARRFMAAMPRVQPHFAVKCNPIAEILSIFHDEGVRFEIASKKELEQLIEIGVNPKEAFYSNPIKSPEHLQFAVDNGVEWYVVDCIDELNKVYQAKPDAKFYLRLHTSNEGSTFELSSKFGATGSDVSEIIQAAAVLKADLAGVTFHAGSQCLNVQNWVIGIRAARAAFDEMLALGLKPRLLNLGGGYPVELGKPVPSIEEIGAAVNAELTAFPDEVQVIAEPGRFLVADSGHFICRVAGTATRGGQRWLYLDTGFYGGLMEFDDMPYCLRTDRQGELINWRLAGPTCDSIDTFALSYALPADLQADDFVYIESGGAYTNSTASNFNGFDLPDIKII